MVQRMQSTLAIRLGACLIAMFTTCVFAQEGTCDDSYNSYISCLESTGAAEQVTQDDDAACATCEATHDEAFASITATSSCNDVLMANCEAFRQCISTCSPICSDEYIAYNLCELTLAFAAQGGCDYQCSSSGASGSTGTGTSANTPVGTTNNPPNASPQSTTTTLSPTTTDDIISDTPCGNEILAHSECLPAEFVPNIAACDECYNAERNKLGVTEQSPCPEQISAGRAGANVCVNSCAPSQCSDAYIAFVLCIADSVSSCDYGTTAGNGGGTTNGINGSPERSSPSGVNSSDGGSSPSLGRHVISVASAVIVLLLIM